MLNNKAIPRPTLCGGIFCFCPVSLFKQFLYLLQLPGFLGAGCCYLAQILDLVKDLLKDVPVFRRKFADKVCVSKQIVANEIRR